MSDPVPTPPTNPAPPPIVSPTGEAQLKLPPWLSWLLVGLAAALATVSQLPVLVPGFVLDPKLAAMALLLSIALAAMGISSAGARKGQAAIVALVAAGALLAPLPAHALDLHAGPSLPLLQLTPGDKHPVAVAPGAGFTVGVDLFPAKLGNRDVHVLTLAGDVFGTLVTTDTANAGAFSIALHAAFFELFTVGVGAKLFTGDKVGFLDGPASYRQSWFLMLGLDGGLVNFLQLGHLGQAPATEVPVDGDHPNGVEEATGAAR